MNYDFKHKYTCSEIFASTCAYCDKRLANKGGSGPSGKANLVFKCDDCAFYMTYLSEWITTGISEEFSHYRLYSMNLVNQMRCSVYQTQIHIYRGESAIRQIDNYNSILIPCETVIVFYSLILTAGQIKNLNKLIMLQ